jgi:hypothetical protein
MAPAFTNRRFAFTMHEHLNKPRSLLHVHAWSFEHFRFPTSNTSSDSSVDYEGAASEAENEALAAMTTVVVAWSRSAEEICSCPFVLPPFAPPATIRSCQFATD